MTDPPILLFEKKLQTEAFSLSESLATRGKPSTWFPREGLVELAQKKR